jgi:hypothetical protein
MLKKIENKDIHNNIIEYKNIDPAKNKDIIVNYSCFCGKYFIANEKMLYILPCCHMVHEKCFNDYIIKCEYKKLGIQNKCEKISKLNCPFCNCKVNTVLNENKINMKKKYNQYRIDLKSVRIDNSAQINYMILPLSLVKLTSLMNKLILVNTEQELLNTIEYLFNVLNIKINIIDNTKNNPIKINNNKISWIKKTDQNIKKVIISNHSHYLDAIIIYYLFRCGFVAGDFINQTDIGKIIASKVKLLVFKRGVDKNMVEKIKEYLEIQKIIGIFPEGAFSNNETLIRFRTGAFYIGESICPIIVKYDKVIYDDDIKQTMFKLITQNEIVVNIFVNDFFYPPFDDNKINIVRDHMLSIGKFENSRVSNKSIKE